jgi:hypothetical protein
MLIELSFKQLMLAQTFIDVVAVGKTEDIFD